VPRKLAATILLAAVVAASASARALAPRASVTTGGKTETYAGGRCIPVLSGFRLTIGRLTGPRYFSLQYVRPLINGLHHGAVVGAHWGSRYYVSPSAAITLRNGGKNGTFAGKWDKRSGGGSFRGTFSC
jgi:hypothetical protein